MKRIALVHSVSKSGNRRTWEITVLPEGETVYNPHKQSCDHFKGFASLEAAQRKAAADGFELKNGRGF